LVDDDPDDIEIVNEALTFVSKEPVLKFANNGIQALQMLDNLYETKELPCLIVLDLNMPKLNGTQTLDKIKKDHRFSQIPVIIYSTSINPLEKEKCLALGAHSYLTKPISIRDGEITARKFMEFCSLL
jgi:CheY-like chemotaxis protein